MRNLNTVFSCFLCVFFFVFSQALGASSNFPVMHLGDSRVGGFSSEAVGLELINNGAYGLNAFSNRGSGSLYFVLFDETLSVVDLDNPNNWTPHELYRWGWEFIEQEVLDRYEEVGLALSEVSYDKDGIGCYAENPMRYGDFHDLGGDELVLFMGNDFVIYSPARSKGPIIFLARLKIDDWVSQQKSLDWYENRSTPRRVRDHDPQYQSALAIAAVGGYQGQRFPGYRGYAKLYFGDFDEDGSKDILVWRKLYVSRLRNDPVDGFQKVSDSYLHYEATDKGYVRAETEFSVVQQWLSVNELTWQDGFPTESECSGEEGAPIPEMHDPLLNDPEVLQ